MSVWPSGQPAVFHSKNFNVGHYMQTSQPSFFVVLLLCFQLYIWGSPFFEIFAYVTIFYFNRRGCHIPSLWMVHAGCVFVAGIHLSRT